MTVLPRGPSDSNATDLAGHRAAGLRLALLCTWSPEAVPGRVSRDPRALPPAPAGFPPWPASCRGYTAPESSAALGGPGLAGGCPQLGSPVWDDSHLEPTVKLPCAGLLPTPRQCENTISPPTWPACHVYLCVYVSVRGAESEHERACLSECQSDGCVHARTRLLAMGGGKSSPQASPWALQPALGGLCCTSEVQERGWAGSACPSAGAEAWWGPAGPR